MNLGCAFPVLLGRCESRSPESKEYHKNIKPGSVGKMWRVQSWQQRVSSPPRSSLIPVPARCEFSGAEHMSFRLFRRVSFIASGVPRCWSPSTLPRRAPLNSAASALPGKRLSPFSRCVLPPSSSYFQAFFSDLNGGGQ